MVAQFRRDSGAAYPRSVKAHGYPPSRGSIRRSDISSSTAVGSNSGSARIRAKSSGWVAKWSNEEEIELQVVSMPATRSRKQMPTTL